jgi:hypothetical protein
MVIYIAFGTHSRCKYAVIENLKENNKSRKVKFAAWMYVSEDKREGVVFAFSLNSDHWSNIVPR